MILMAVVDVMIATGVSYAWTRRGAAAPDYTLAVSRPLKDKADEYGPKEIDRLQAWLAADVEKALAERVADGRAPVHLALVLEDARPSRPPGLSIARTAAPRRGGATISGAVTRSDGRTTLVIYRAYRKAGGTQAPDETWADARAAFRVFAEMIADDKFGRCAAEGCTRAKAWKAAA